MKKNTSRVETMKIWLISQDENKGYDTYDAAVVIARTEDDARNILPFGIDPTYGVSEWCSSPSMVKVQYLGEANPEAVWAGSGVVLGSFNAG